MWPLVTVYIEGLKMRVIGGEHREWHCLVWHVWVYVRMHLCMYLKCAIGWRDWGQQCKRSIECMMHYLPLLGVGGIPICSGIAVYIELIPFRYIFVRLSYREPDTDYIVK